MTTTETIRWHLTSEEEELILATARYNKIKLLQWKAKADWYANDIEHVELTDKEKTDALESANRTKSVKLYFENIAFQNREKERLKAEALAAEWDYARFYKEMRHRAINGATKPDFKFVFDEHTAPLIKTICFKLSQDPRYETEMGFSFRKGLIIRGTPGLGKSYLLGLVADNPVCPVQIVTMHEIVRSILDTGDYRGLKFASYSLVYLDDVGTEYDGIERIKYMGTEINWFKTWFEEFYAKSKSCVNRIIFSTNNNFDDLEKKYGFRVRDRLAECFDVLDVTGRSLRKSY